MDIAFHIPTWVFWALGVPLAAAIVFMAALGVAFVRCFSRGLY